MPDSSDIAEINRLRYEYAFGIDTKDYSLLRSVFTKQLAMDFSSYDGNPAATYGADEWVERVSRLFDGLDATQHSMMNPLVDLAVDAQTATQRMAMQAAHFLDGVEFTIGGWYQDELVRTNDGWKIAAVTLHVTWRRGDESIMAKAVRGG